MSSIHTIKAFLFQTMLDELDDEMLLLDEVDTKENFSLVTITITIAINITINTFNPPPLTSASQVNMKENFTLENITMGESHNQTMIQVFTIC